MDYDYKKDIREWEKKHGKVKYSDRVIRPTFKRNVITKEEEEEQEDEK